MSRSNNNHPTPDASAATLSRRERREQAQRFITQLAGETFPNSDRVYLHPAQAGAHADLRVPMRRIHLSPSLLGGTPDAPLYQPNEPVLVYDTAGAYGDPEQTIDVTQRLPPLRDPWIAGRNDTQLLEAPNSSYAPTQQQNLAAQVPLMPSIIRLQLAAVGVSLYE